jgi:hypothetical protein
VSSLLRYRFASVHLRDQFQHLLIGAWPRCLAQQTAGLVRLDVAGSSFGPAALGLCEYVRKSAHKRRAALVGVGPVTAQL